jgi:hypothetical protein
MKTGDRYVKGIKVSFLNDKRVNWPSPDKHNPELTGD